MPLTMLDPATADRLRSTPFTYPEVGRTGGPLPAGYTAFSRSRPLALTDFDAATDALLSWQVQLRAGLAVAASSARIEPDAVAVLRIGLGPIGIVAPCRVVYVVDGARRRGFAYGTLPGHPESGEESFVLTLDEDNRITFTVTAFSKPATILAKLGGPIARTFQRTVTNRYLQTIDR